MNIKKLNLGKKTFVFDNSVFHFLDKITKIEDGYDLVFLDPPFKSENLSILIKLIKDKKLVNKNGIMITHRHKKTKDDILENFEFKLEKKGKISVSDKLLQSHEIWRKATKQITDLTLMEDLNLIQVGGLVRSGKSLKLGGSHLVWVARLCILK